MGNHNCTTAESRLEGIEGLISRGIEATIRREAKVEKTDEVKILILGPRDSGKTTIVKQMKMTHTKGFNSSEIENYRHLIRGTLIECMLVLIHGMKNTLKKDFESEVNEGNWIRLCEFHELYLKDPGESFPLNTLRQTMKTLWADENLQKCFRRRHKIKLMDSAPYFLDRIDEITRFSYQPERMDIIHCLDNRAATQATHLKVKDHLVMLIDIGRQSNQKKWLHFFEDVDAVLFVASLADYDQNTCEGGHPLNKLHYSIELFQQMCSHKGFHSACTVLFLNKVDSFGIKLKVRPLTICFPGFRGNNDFSEASAFIWNVFHLVKQERALYTHMTCAIDTLHTALVMDNVAESLIHHEIKETCVV